MVVIDHDESVFEPEAAQAMSHVFDDVCAFLHIPHSADRARDRDADHRNRPREVKCLRYRALPDFPALIAHLEGCGELHG